MATRYANKPEIKNAVALHELLRERRGSGIGRHDDIRIHRAISWISAAERNKDDTDVAFMCFWNAYEASYQFDKAHMGYVQSFRER